jgi:hypothetical protein
MTHTLKTREAARSDLFTQSEPETPAGIKSTLAGPDVAPKKIATLVDFHREGRFVIAYCPLCDHAEEAEDVGGGREQTASISVAKIEAHLRRIHRDKTTALKFTFHHRPQTPSDPNR